MNNGLLESLKTSFHFSAGTQRCGVISGTAWQLTDLFPYRLCGLQTFKILRRVYSSDIFTSFKLVDCNKYWVAEITKV